MATRWKSFSRNVVTKVILTLAAAVSVAAACGTLYNALFVYDVNIEAAFEQDYISSRRHADEVAAILLRMEGLLNVEEALTKEQVSSSFGADVWYYFSDGKKSYTNAQGKGRSFFENFATSYIAAGGRVSVGENANPTAVDNAYTPFVYGDGSYTAYLAFTDEFIQQKEEIHYSERTEAIRLLNRLLAILVFCLFCVVWLVLVAGKKKEDEEIHLCWLDSVFTEIIAAAGIALFVFAVYLVDEVATYHSWASFGVTLVVGTASVGLITLALSLVRRLKSRTFFSQCFGVKCICGVWSFFAGLFDGRRFRRYRLYRDMVFRDVMFVGLELFFGFLTIVFFDSVLMFPPMGACIAVLYFYLRGRKQMFTDMGKLLNQIDRISDGELNSFTDISPNAPLYGATCKLADIGSGMRKSVEKQIRDERMKIDLITNVSHDLKTPLTSIIGYIDLMKKEEGLSFEMQDYVEILSQKSDRLKSIVSDLFDLAKATSGNAEIQMERLDLCKLVIQTLGDMEDKIQASGQNLKTEIPEFPVYIIADGKKLYRVFQNIVENALKYALPGTRIFIQLVVENKHVYATVKNTASYEMNFTAEEILERFSRGDKARTTDGSGLGLSIAESFTQVCGGQFYVVVDGDQFKTSVVFDVID